MRKEEIELNSERKSFSFPSVIEDFFLCLLLPTPRCASDELLGMVQWSEQQHQWRLGEGNLIRYWAAVTTVIVPSFPLDLHNGRWRGRGEKQTTNQPSTHSGFYLKESVFQQLQDLLAILLLNDVVSDSLIGFNWRGCHLVDKLRKQIVEALGKDEKWRKVRNDTNRLGMFK